MIGQYLERYINVVKWDFEKLKRVAEEAQAKYDLRYGRNNLSPATPPVVEQTHITGSASTLPENVITTTQMPRYTPVPAIEPTSNVQLFYERHTLEYARCTVPIAMVLTSAVEFFGALIHDTDIWGNSNKFDTSVKNFFTYANMSPALTQNHVDLYRAIYRNGFMHGFFPQGMNIGINYDSSFENEPKLFFMDKGDIVFNVNRLKQIVEVVFDKIVADTAKHPTIQARLDDYNAYVELKTKDIVDTFKTNYVP